MYHKIKRGEIYYADLNPIVGSEQGMRRPVLVISNDMGNKYSPTVIIAPITGKTKKMQLPTHVYIPKSCVLDRDSLVLTEQIRAIDRSRLTDYVGCLNRNIMTKVDVALLTSVGL